MKESCPHPLRKKKKGAHIVRFQLYKTLENINKSMVIESISMLACSWGGVDGRDGGEVLQLGMRNLLRVTDTLTILIRVMASWVWT